MTFWSLTNSDFPTNQTFHQFHDLDTELDLHWLWVVSMEHLQGAWHISRERLPLRTPGSSPYGGLHMLRLLRPVFPTLHRFTCNDRTELDLHRNKRGFHGAFATDVACQQGALTLLDTWFRPTIVGLACATIVETRFLELAMSFTRLFTSNTPWYFLDFALFQKGLNNNCSHCLLNTNKRQRAQLA